MLVTFGRGRDNGYSVFVIFFGKLRLHDKMASSPKLNVREQLDSIKIIFILNFLIEEAVF